MSTKDIDELKEIVALSHRIMFVTGLTTSSGHSSARIPGTNTFLIKPWPHIHMNRIRAQDIITLDFDGNKVTGPEHVTAVSEWALHAEVYKMRPDVNGVIHSHQRWSTMMGIAGKTIMPVFYPSPAGAAAEPMRVYDEDYATIKVPAEGRAVALKLGNHVGVHLRTHGMLFAAPNLETATVEAIHTEYQAELTWRAMQIGKPNAIPAIALRPHAERKGPDDVPEAWEYFKWLDAHPESARYRVVPVQ